MQLFKCILCSILFVKFKWWIIAGCSMYNIHSIICSLYWDMHAPLPHYTHCRNHACLIFYIQYSYTHAIAPTNLAQFDWAIIGIGSSSTLIALFPEVDKTLNNWVCIKHIWAKQSHVRLLINTFYNKHAPRLYNYTDDRQWEGKIDEQTQIVCTLFCMCMENKMVS